MERALELRFEAEASLARRAAVAVLLAASGALARLAASIEQPGSAESEELEIGVVEVGGERRGAVYAGGRLLGVLPDIERL